MNRAFPESQLILLALVLISACSPPGSDTAAPAGVEEPPVMERTSSADGARVFFIMPADGARVTNPVRVEFGLTGMAVVPAGDDSPDSGHHHLIIDGSLPDFDLPIPKDEHHLHFGDGSSATELTLSPGQHTLQLLLGDHLHIPHDPPVFSEQIRIAVE
ncbi:MAG: DUF4399 domain-containing protein [Woeseia sp.]